MDDRDPQHKIRHRMAVLRHAEEVMPRARIHAGTASINGGGGGPHLGGPFGGYKQSGIGREFEEYGLLEYTQLKTVSWSPGRP